MKLLVTGATGFIGSYFVRAALAAGHEVIAVRRSKESAPVIPLPMEPQWLTMAVEDLQASDFSGCGALVHFAATGVSPKPATWSECFRFNAQVALELVQKAQNAGVNRVVVSGSYAEYGRSGLRFDLIPSDAPLEPTDPYAASKAAGFLALASFARFSKLGFYYGRIFSAFGEGQADLNFWPQLKKAALEGSDFPMTLGEQVRDFLPVEEVADIFLDACVRTDLLPGEPMVRNVASGVPVTLKEFAEVCWKRWCATGELKLGAVDYRPHEVMRYVPLVERA